MIPLQEAIERALRNATLYGTKKLSFTETLGRILAEDIISDIDIPPFNKSAMDGYAYRREDENMPLKVVQLVQAGYSTIPYLNKGECVKIMTGARLPENANAVAKIENTQLDEEGRVIIVKTENKSNIRYVSEDVKKGDIVLKKGTLIRPQEIATFATVGKTFVEVYKQPNVAIASTGNELVEPQHIPNENQIRNSNAYQLLAQCQRIGIKASYFGIISDEINSTREQIEKMLIDNDVILLTGGVSMGDFDYVPESLKQLGFEIVFHTISVQPGKPTLMAKKGNQFCFGLPGNPVSSFMQFELIVKPFLYKCMGYDYIPTTNYLPLMVEYKRKKAERTSLVPVKIVDNKVTPVEYHGSAHLFALNNADGFIIVPQNTTLLHQNTYVTVRLF